MIPYNNAADASVFLSTPSARRATSIYQNQHQAILISIHALREEGDSKRHWIWARPPHFYPRPPRGGRLSLMYHKRARTRFLSTPSARRATTRMAP